MTLVVHPYAAAFPMMSGDELDALADDIKANGLRHLIVVDKDGVLIDGRNRLAACERAGVEPRFETLPADLDPVDYIVGANVERRHLTTGQRAMARAMALHAQGKRENGRWAYGSKAENGRSSISDAAWRKAMREAGVVLDETPGAAVAVIDASLSLDAAYTAAKSIRESRNDADEGGARATGKLHALRRTHPDLADQVAAGTLDLAGADRIVDERSRTAELPEDLQGRVSTGGLAIDEAELIVRERLVRAEAWAAKIRDSMRVFARMADAEIPAELPLTDPERDLLTTLLTSMKGEDHDWLR